MGVGLGLGLGDGLGEGDGLGVGVPDGTEHSFTPPDTLLPAPNVASEQTKLPLNVL